MQTLRQAESPYPPTSCPGAQNRGAPAQWPARCLQGSTQLPTWGPPYPHADHGVRNRALPGPHNWFRDEGVTQADPSEVEGRPKAPSPGSHPSPTTH